MDNELNTKIAALMEQETAYTADAYHFVAQAVNYTVDKLPSHRHVTALELLKGTRELAIKEFGAVAHEVLHEFGLRTAMDVGKVVYLLISVNVLSSAEDDSPEDFNIDFEPVPALEDIEIVCSGSVNVTID